MIVPAEELVPRKGSGFFPPEFEGEDPIEVLPSL